MASRLGYFGSDGSQKQMNLLTSIFYTRKIIFRNVLTFAAVGREVRASQRSTGTFRGLIITHVGATLVAVVLREGQNINERVRI